MTGMRWEAIAARARGVLSRPSALAKRVARVQWRRALTVIGLFASPALVVAGIALIYPPAGLIAGGLGLFALLTFDLAKVGRLTWPR